MSVSRVESAEPISEKRRPSTMRISDRVRFPEPPEDVQKRRRSHSKPLTTSQRPESMSMKPFVAVTDKQASQLSNFHADFATADSTTGAEILEAIMRRSHHAAETLEAISVATKRRPPRPSEGCVGSIPLQGILQSPHVKRSSSLTQIQKHARTPSADSSSSRSTTDSESLLAHRLSTDSSSSESTSRENSRPPSRGGSSCGSLDLPGNAPEAECEATEGGFEWALNQFKEGQVPFSAIATHLQMDDPDIRRSVVEAVGMATAHVTLESTQAVKARLSDSNPFVRRASVNSLCAVLVKAENSTAVELARRTLMHADPCIKFDAIEALMNFAIKGSKRAATVMDLYRLDDKDPSIRCKAQRSLATVAKAGRAKKHALQGAKLAIALSNEVLSNENLYS